MRSAAAMLRIRITDTLSSLIASNLREETRRKMLPTTPTIPVGKLS